MSEVVEIKIKRHCLKRSQTIKVKQLGLGIMKVISFVQIKPNERCWICDIGVKEVVDITLSLVIIHGTDNKLLCNQCGLDLMEKGAKVVRNDLPPEIMRKYRIKDLLDKDDKNEH